MIIIIQIFKISLFYDIIKMVNDGGEGGNIFSGGNIS